MVKLGRLTADSYPVSRLGASVVVVAEEDQATRSCLDALRPTLGARDQVIVVLPSTRQSYPNARWLRHYPWVETVALSPTGGPDSGRADSATLAAGWREGALRATNPVTVFLHADVRLAPRWLDQLVASLDAGGATSGVLAAAPLTNHGCPHQEVGGLPYAPANAEAFRSFARSVAHDRRGIVSPKPFLGAPAVAVVTAALEEAGGFDEGLQMDPEVALEDLCVRLTSLGGKVAVAEGSFVHHRATCLAPFDERRKAHDLASRHFVSRHGRSPDSAPEPLVSACLIARDEEEDLPACLASLRGFADEVVLYDTGSTDSTREVAANAGAKVIDGFWDDDFSRARNAALEQCSGTWIAWLDADETLVTDDRQGLRNLLERCPEGLEGFLVSIDNLTGAGTGTSFVHVACRLFRRRSGSWRGRLHEQVAAREGREVLRLAPLEGARLRHTGYLDKRMAARSKMERNLRVAKAEVDDEDSGDPKTAIPGYSWVSLGRSLGTLPGRHEEALEYLVRGVEETNDPTTRRLGERSAAELLIGLGRLDEALEWIGRLRADSATNVLPDSLQARVHLKRGEHREALELLETITGPVRDDDLFEYDHHAFAAMRAEALVGLGRHSEAADALLGSLAERGALDTHLGELVACLKEAGRDLREVATALPPDRLKLFLAQVLQFRPEPADELLDACFEELPERATVLATAASIARRLPLDRALTWSHRLRIAGLASSCPLIAIAEDPSEPARRRAHAAAIVAQAFGDERGREALGPAFCSLLAVERDQVAAELRQIAPRLDAELNALASGFDAGRKGSPSVSIVVVAEGSAEGMLAFFESLAASLTGGIGFEVIVVLPKEVDARTAMVVASLGGDVRVIPLADAQSVGEAMLAGVHAARGGLVAVVNRSCRFAAGWLEPLVDLLASSSRLGAVGPLFTDPGGLCIAAGGYRHDGRLELYGVSEPVGAPLVARRAAPDFLPLSCILMTKDALSALEAVLGATLAAQPLPVGQPSAGQPSIGQPWLEPHELSMQVCSELRRRGWGIALEPASVVQLAEAPHAPDMLARDDSSDTSGRTDISGRIAADTAGASSAADIGPDEKATPTIVRCMRRPEERLAPRVLFLDRHPGSLRARALLGSLERAGANVTLSCFRASTRSFAASIGELDIACFGWDSSSAPSDALLRQRWDALVRPSIDELLEHGSFDMVFLGAGSMDHRLLQRIRRRWPGLVVATDTDMDPSPPLDADHWVCASQVPVSQFPEAQDGSKDPWPCFHLVADAVELPTRALPRVARAGIVTCGSTGLAPVREALRGWAEEAAPLLADFGVTSLLRFVGPDTVGLLRSQRLRTAITPLGVVPDPRPYLATALVMVAPYHACAYTAEVVAALAAGTPVVTTPAVSARLCVGNDEGVLVCGEPNEMAVAASSLLGDSDLWHEMSSRALRAAERLKASAGDPSLVDEEMRDLLLEVTARRLEVSA